MNDTLIVQDQEKDISMVSSSSKIEKKAADVRPYALPKAFMQQILQCASPEEKLSACIEFMRHILVGDAACSFGNFWEARRLCLSLFKENVPQGKRVVFWGEYQDLCHEARKLKEIFEEQGAFIVEQIESTIIAIQEDIKRVQSAEYEGKENEKISSCSILRQNEPMYQEIQGELEYLNAFASRINSLRKEVVNAKIGHKQKKQLLQRLRDLGDHIFPLRKEKIKGVSDLFMSDIQEFIKNTFAAELSYPQLLHIKETVCRAQQAASALTLSTEAFVTTRKQLSECFEMVTKKIAALRKEKEEKSHTLKKHKDEAVSMLNVLKEGLENGSMSEIEGRRGIHLFRSRLSSLPLIPKDAHEMKKQLRELEDLLEERKNFHSSSKVKALDTARYDQQKARAFLDDVKTFVETSGEDQTAFSSIRELFKKLSKIGFQRDERDLFDHMMIESFEKIISRLKKQTSSDMSAQERENLRLMVIEVHELVSEHVQMLKKLGGDSRASFSSAMENIEMIKKDAEALQQLEDLHDLFEAKA